MTEHGRDPALLARYFALAWFGLLVYGCLHPFSGWRSTGISPTTFLTAAWPRYWTFFDLIANTLIYIPFGFFLALAFRKLPGRFTAPIIAVILAGMTTFGLETLQTWLPSRVASNIDLGFNFLGGILGAIAAQYAGPRVFARVASLLHRLIAPLPHAELGLTLLGLWLFVPLSPELLLFGAGDLRHWIAFPNILPFVAESFAQIESYVTALNAVAVGLILSVLCRNRAIAYLLVPIFLLIGLIVRTLAAATLINPNEAFAWMTQGAQNGLLISAAVLAVLMALPIIPRLALAALALVAGTVFVNFAPPNPYSTAALATWQQGHFLNFNGLTRLVASLWPFFTLPFLVFLNRRL